MTKSTNRRKAAGFLLLSSGLVAMLALVGFSVPQSPLATLQIEAAPVVCNTTFFALDPANPALPNPAKEVPAAFGPAVTVRGETDVKAELNERRECGADGLFDPALTASLYSGWSKKGLTKYTVTSTGIDAFYAQIAADKDLYGEVLDELKRIENESVYSEAEVSAGVWSLFMVPNGTGGVNVGQGLTSAVGTNAVFTHPSGAVVKYRLDCGFQLNQEDEFPDVPKCTPEQCPPPTCPPGWFGTWPECYAPKWETDSPVEPGWNPRGTDNGLTDGGESRRQLESGETRGNAVNDQVNSNTGNHTTTNDTVHSNEGGPVADGGTVGGDDQSQGTVDEVNTNQDVGGTTGDTCVPDGIVVLTCP